MADLALIESGPSKGDLLIQSGDAVLLNGIEAIRQHVSMRLQMFQGEYFLDQRIGMPYFQEILIKNPGGAAIQSIFAQAIGETPGIGAVSNLVLDYDGATRGLTVSFTATASTGEVLDFEQELIL